MKSFLLILCFLFFSCYSKENKYLTKIEKEINIKDTLSFKNIFNNDWDEMLVITPYSNLNKLSEKYNLNLSIINNSIEFSDNINTVVFIKKKKVINYIEIPRKKLQFRKIDGLISKKNSLFIVVKEKVDNVQIIYLEPVI